MTTSKKEQKKERDLNLTQIKDLFIVRENIRMFQNKVREFEVEYELTKQNLYSTLKNKANAPTDQGWVYNWFEQQHRERCEKFKKEIKRFSFYIDKIKGKVKNVIDIDLCKKVKIEDFIVGEKERRGDKLWYKCPLHNEKTPSFVVYQKTNTYYCFGCGQGGDNIDLYMKLNNCDFKTAIQELINLG